jgi:hypothetical protein
MAKSYIGFILLLHLFLKMTILIYKSILNFKQHLKESIMGKGKDAKKNVKKEAAKTPKEKKAAKRLKKAK